MKNKRKLRKQWKENEKKSFYKSVEHGYEYKPEVAEYRLPVDLRKDNEASFEEPEDGNMYEANPCDDGMYLYRVGDNWLSRL